MLIISLYLTVNANNFFVFNRCDIFMLCSFLLISGFPNGNNFMSKPSKIQQIRREEGVGERRGGIEERWKEMRGGIVREEGRVMERDDGGRRRCSKRQI